MSDSINFLRSFLNALPSRTVANVGELSGLLAQCWDEFSGCNEGGMQARKLVGRVEGAEWSPPILMFVIERHGATVHGSTRADLQHWRVDMDQRVASLTETGRRQLCKMARRLDVRPLCEEICELIVKGQPDPRLYWKGNSEVQVRIGEVIPDNGHPQTIQGRRRRFRTVLSDILIPHGWQPTSRRNVYRRTMGEG